ncbi:Vacuolar-sorting protein SNF8 [Plasmodiophora brassicae]|uniref:Vacuolar-sorting protein SNF8 n=1 Tax=Plasmodiophora brassicae TaxID=37360 RepID=A0A0G4IR79_PLABS|nr:hypothetical protein PBRA_005811 [Plasmodiophora brassicae]SPQ98240.1 unnamed protein product [Plasmodiophora brassicae]
MRRGVGVGGLKKQKEAAAKFRQAGKEIEQTQMAHVRASLAVFKEKLESFAIKHRNEIRSNPQFRAQFAKMCSKIGVDPLASNKGFWSELLGVGDFYYELSVQIIEICLATRPQNGGLLSLMELLTRLERRRGASAQAISVDDVRRAIEKVQTLGKGFGIVHVDNRPMILSVPTEFNRDHTDVLAVAQQSDGHTSLQVLGTALQWPEARCEKVLQLLLDLGIAWVDCYDPQKHEYWFPSLINNADNAVQQTLAI